jgi:polyhydroxyalkanoate synthase
MLAGSGHIAGVVNPPTAKKYNYWINESHPNSLEEWMDGAQEHPGSWWPDWHKWLSKLSGRRVPARKPGAGKLKSIEDAPGFYVKMT